ncbi:hypothetical protein BD560DRAFT_422684 [Blakeslea trispora]|nr:hypothetical protein BD560DRAFT_422684 [Blakeslea trispora]
MSSLSLYLSESLDDSNTRCLNVKVLVIICFIFELACILQLEFVFFSDNGKAAKQLAVIMCDFNLIISRILIYPNQCKVKLVEFDSSNNKNLLGKVAIICNCEFDVARETLLLALSNNELCIGESSYTLPLNA